MEQVWKWITSPRILLSAALTVGAFALWLAVSKAHKHYVSAGKAKGEKATVVRVISGVFRSVILIGALLIVLQINGVNVSSAVAGLGLLSAIVGLALQDALKDIIMGVHIISDRFFSVGDVVKYRDIEGVVIAFTIRTTTIRDIYDQTVTTVCNRNISEITKMPESAQVDIDLPLSYSENTAKIHALLQKICKQIDGLDGIERCVYKGTQEFSSSAVIYKIRFFCPPEDKPERTRDALRLIQDGLDAADVHIPFNQLDVHTIAP